MTKLPPGLSYESTLEHVIEHIVLNMIAPNNSSDAEIRDGIRQCSKALLRLGQLQIPSDAVIDELASELIEWHAPRCDEPGWNPDLAGASAGQRMMAAKAPGRYGGRRTSTGICRACG